MVDWRLAERVAEAVAGGDGAGAPLAGGADLDAMAARAVEHVTAYARIQPAVPPPPLEAVGRKEWARVNLETMGGTLEPLLERLGNGPLQSVGGVLIGVEAGGIVGFMGRNVLGQYELSLLDPERPPRLLLVAPNLREAARSFEADEGELLEWVVFHEITHAVQFSAVEWLRPHLAGLLGELLASTEVSVDAGSLQIPTLDDARALWDRARDGGLVGAVAGPERAQLLERVQCAMAVVEGHAEHVMDAAGAPLVPQLGRLRDALETRRAERSPLASLLERLLGLELKLRQYRDGKRFCDAVVERAGIAGLNRAFADPRLLPTAAELAAPGDWIARTRPRALPAAS